MSYILQQSWGCCRQDSDIHIYKTKNPQKRLKKLFLDLLSDSEYLNEDIDDIKTELNEEDYIEEDHYYYDGNEAWVDFDDVYSTRTYLNIVN